MLKVDLHTHTNYIQPYEGNYSPKTLIDHAVKLGFDAIAITEHCIPNPPRWFVQQRENPLDSYFHFKDYAEKKGLLLIPGVELTVEGKEVLLINFKGNPAKYKKLNDLKRLPKNVLTIVSHPFFKKKNCMGELLEPNIHLFDAIEYSHFYTKWLNLNKKAVKITEEYGKRLIGTSDAHRLYQMGHTYTMIDAEKNADAIVDAIKHKKFRMITKPLNTRTFLKIALFAATASALQRVNINI